MLIPKRYLLSLAIAFFSIEASAQNQAAQQEIQSAKQEAMKVMVQGPSTIRIKDQANFSLPKGDGFIPTAAAARYLRAIGGSPDEKSLIGLIVPLTQGADWLALISVQQDGYIRDDDARDWKPDQMLASLKAGTENDNPARKERGLQELEVSDWAEPPNYDAQTHRLRWSAIVRTKEHAGSEEEGVNYRTLVLGRDGFLSLTMATHLSSLVQDKPIAENLLADIQFDDGKRYSDFSASTDHIAEYGLGALIVGVAAKKIGLIAVILAFAAKFAKVILVAAAAFGISIKKIFSRKPVQASVVSTPAPALPVEPVLTPVEPNITDSAEPHSRPPNSPL